MFPGGDECGPLFHGQRGGAQAEPMEVVCRARDAPRAGPGCPRHSPASYPRLDDHDIQPSAPGHVVPRRGVAGHVEIEKTYRGKVPQTLVRLTRPGRAAFEGYRKRLNAALAEQLRLAPATNKSPKPK